jgi:3-phenylpropionate/trans-cinnamate dioxygenase ferredoxin reductase subunit
MIADVLVVGAGQAGLQLVSSLREGGFSGSVTLVGEEPLPPYQRPPLTKAYLAGQVNENSLFMQEDDFFANHLIRFRSGVKVTSIDRRHRRISLSDGSVLDYGRLVLATGARNRALPQHLGAPMGLLSIRTLSDAQVLRRRMGPDRRLAVIGAGFLGLEAAVIASAAGCAVEVIEIGSHALGRAVSPQLSELFSRYHRSLGIRFRFHTMVESIRRHADESWTLTFDAGADVVVDDILVAIGVTPNTDLAEQAGLDVADGIIVDEWLRTSDPDIYAIGDCSAFPHQADGNRLVRLESVQNAVDQARAVAAHILGNAVRYDEVPLFWSNQAGLRLQIAGVARPTDAAVVRGAPADNSCSVFRFRDDRLVAVESVNRPGDHMQARRLLKAGAPLTPAQAADPGFDLKSLYAPTPVAG